MESIEAQAREKDSRTSATTQSTPFFVGTNHKELRALLHARDNPEAWAAMLEKEHPVQDWCDAYKALLANQDAKLAVLLTLIYYQNERWLKAHQSFGTCIKDHVRILQRTTWCFIAHGTRRAFGNA